MHNTKLPYSNKKRNDNFIARTNYMKFLTATTMSKQTTAEFFS